MVFRGNPADRLGSRSALRAAFHQQHFKPANLKRSWTKEETLTWELYRALDLLPRDYFLRPFLRSVAKVSPEAADAAAPLLRSIDEIDLRAYPSMKLGGNKRNRRADLGIGYEGSQRIWIEVKTRAFKHDDLQKQVSDEMDALMRLTPASPVAVVALLPETERAGVDECIGWRRVYQILQRGIRSIAALDVPKGLIRGHVACARELLGRLKTHDPPLVA